MSNLVNFKSANLPTVQSLSTALRKIEVEVGGIGTVIIKMDKTGHWTFGTDQTEVEDGSLWAINPFSFVHGYIAWGVAEVLGEKMVSIADPLPELTEAPAGAAKGWEFQVGLSMKCISGEDKGMEARYSTTATGGKRAVQELAIKIAEQVEKNQDQPVPIVLLKSDHYMHKAYSRIYVPVFDIQKWTSMDGEEPAATEEAEAYAEASQSSGRRRRAV